MLSITTNLQSQIAQNSLKTSTNKLNQAIERMSIGCKINHASDNAANYSISTNMTTKLSAYQVAEDNVTTGIDLVTTASDTISLMQDKAARLSALSTQARNGTYGAQSLNAINAEANSIVAELSRLYNTAEFNGVKLFNRQKFTLPDTLPKTREDGFIADPKTYTDAQVQAMETVSEATSFVSGHKYSISSVEELQRLATEVNSGVDTTGVEFVLGDDIDLSSIDNWIPIGNYTNKFKGTFDGNGHVVRNLKINRTENYQGLFGRCERGGLKNIGLENIDIAAAMYVGSLAGVITGKITNCYATGVVKGTGYQVGGLAGEGDFITNSYAYGNVAGSRQVGGLAGWCNSIINSYAIGNVSGEIYIGGLVGWVASITNSYATGNVIANDGWVGGLAGATFASVVNSYATGSVSGNKYTGGLIGSVNRPDSVISIDKCTSYGTVNGADSNSTGSFVGGIVITRDSSTFGTVNITNSTALSQDLSKIGGCYNTGGALLPDYDMTSMSVGIDDAIPNPLTTILQVGINGDNSCSLEFSTNFVYDFTTLLEGGIESESAYNQINDLMNRLSEKSTELGAVQNRLESALESISVNIENLASSRSTLRDADMSEVSSEYIRQQILQEASATLMSTANQSPALALQLL